MNLLLILCDDLMKDVLSRWIGQDTFVTLVALDIAICHKETRYKYLRCLNRSGISFHPQKFDDLQAYRFFIQWWKSRGLILSNVVMKNCLFQYESSFSLLRENLHSLAAIDIDVIATGFDISNIFLKAPLLKTFSIRVFSPICFSQPIESLGLSLKHLQIDLKYTNSSSTTGFEDMITFLDKNASQLQKFDLCSQSIDDFFMIFAKLTRLIELSFLKSNHLIGLDDERTISFPQGGVSMLKRLFLTSFYTGKVLSQVLHHCPQLEELSIVNNHNYSTQRSAEYMLYEDTFLYALQHSFAFLTSCTLQDRYVVNIEQLIAMLPSSNRLQHFSINNTTAMARNTIVEKFPCLQSLQFTRSKLYKASWENPIIVPQKMIHLTELGLEYMYLPDTSYEKLFQNAPSSFKALKRLKIMFGGGRLVNRPDTLLKYFFQSPLVKQVTHVSFGLWDCKEYFRVKKWNVRYSELLNIRSLTLFNIVVIPMEELLSMIPNVENVKLHSGYYQPDNEPHDGISMCCCPVNERLLSTKVLQLVPKLKELECHVERGFQPKEESWQDILSAVPSLDTFLLHEKEGVLYWKKENVGHNALLRKFKYKIKFTN